MKKRRNTLFTGLAVFGLLLGSGALVSAVNANEAAPVQAADYLNNSVDLTGNEDEGALTTLSLDANWDLTGDKGTANFAPTFYATGLRVYSVRQTGLGNILKIMPSAANVDKVLTKVSFTAISSGYAAAAIKVRVGNSATDLVEVPNQAFVGLDYTYTNPDGFRYFELTNAHMGGDSNLQLRFSQLAFDYRDDDTTYDPVASFDVNFAETQLVIGESYSFAPTILPTTANQMFQVESSSPAVEVSGETINVVGAAENVEITLTTVGLNAEGLPLTAVVTFNAVQATTTVAEALTLTPGTGIVYLVENAKVGGTYDPNTDREITLVDSLDPTKEILIFSYGFNPKNSYRYIPGGTISFKAPLGSYSEVNQFINPIEVISYTDKVEEFAASILTGDVDGQCIDRFDGYKAQVLEFTADELAKLQNGTDTNITNARARYLAWAAHLGQDPYTAGVTPVNQQVSNTNNQTLVLVLIISVVGATLLGSYLIVIKRRKQN